MVSGLRNHNQGFVRKILITALNVLIFCFIYSFRAATESGRRDFHRGSVERGTLRHEQLDFAYSILATQQSSSREFLGEMQLSSHHRDYSIIVEPVDDLISSPHVAGESVPKSPSAAHSRKTRIAQSVLAASSMPREQRELLPMGRQVFCPSSDAATAEGEWWYRSHVVKLLQDFPRRTFLTISIPLCGDTSSTSAMPVHLVVFGELDRFHDADIANLIVRCLSDIRCDGVSLTMEFAQIREDLLLSTSRDGAAGYWQLVSAVSNDTGIASEQQNFSTPVYYFLRDRVHESLPLQFHTHAIEVLSGPKLRRASAKANESGGHALAPLLSVRIVDRWWAECTGAAGGLIARVVRLPVNGNPEEERIEEESEATVVQGSGIVPLSTKLRRRSDYIGGELRLDIVYAPLPVLSKTLHDSNQLHHSVGSDITATPRQPLSLRLFTNLRGHHNSSRDLIGERQEEKRNVFVLFSIVANDPKIVCDDQKSDKAASIGPPNRTAWKKHAERMWNEMRAKARAAHHLPAVVAVHVTVSEAVFKACPKKFSSNEAASAQDSTVEVSIIAIDDDLVAPSSLAMHSRIHQFAMRFQRVVDYFAFYNDGFFASLYHKLRRDTAELEDEVTVLFSPLQTSALLEPGEEEVLRQMRRNVWLSAALRGPNVLTQEPTFPYAAHAPRRDKSSRLSPPLLSSVGIVLSRHRTLALFDRVRSLFVLTAREAFAAAVDADRSDISMSHFAQVLLLVVANDDCLEPPVKGSSWLWPMGVTENRHCAILLS